MDEDTIKHYLKIHVDLREKHASMNMREAGYAYSCQEDFVLREGTLYTEMSERVYKPGIPRYCFHNAYVAASRSRGKLRYCEGYALSSFMPVPHGWCIDPDGRVVDVTWCGDGSTERIDDGFNYHRPRRVQCLLEFHAARSFNQYHVALFHCPGQQLTGRRRCRLWRPCHPARPGFPVNPGRRSRPC